MLLACFTRSCVLLVCPFLFLMFQFIDLTHSCLLLACFTGCRALAVCTFSLSDVTCALSSYVRCSLKTTTSESTLLVLRMPDIRYVVCHYHDKLSILTAQKLSVCQHEGTWKSMNRRKVLLSVTLQSEHQQPTEPRLTNFKFTVKIDNLSW